MTVPTRSDPRWGPVPFPGWLDEIRPGQWEAAEQAYESFQAGDEVVYLEAPTGSGKSLIGEMVRRLLGTSANYVCTTKALQDQYAESFPYGRVIKGKSNYATELGNVDDRGRPWDRPWSAITCADCTFNNKTETCKWCRNTNFCPYGVAKTKARFSDLAILNTSFFLTDAQYVGHFRGRGLTVLDEADLLEGELLSRVEVYISEAQLERMMLKGPERKTPGKDGKGAVEWASWIRNVALPAVDFYLARIPKPWMEGVTPKQIREYKRTTELKATLFTICPDVALGGWVYDGYDENEVIFRPVRVEKYGSEILWPTSEKFLIMSATILSADLMNDDLGGYKPYSSITLPSTFPKENRPIYVCDVADMSKKAWKESHGETWKRMVQGVEKVLAKHPGERVLVHTVSYELGRFLRDRLAGLVDRPLITYTTSDEKTKALEEYKRKKGAVLLAPSMDRGIDLPDDYCRVMVVAKIPFLDLGDKRIEARLWSPGGRNWYRMQAIRTLIQMTGRGVRHEDDKAETYILDSQFLTNLWKASFLFPPYWQEAINWRRNTRWLMSEAA